MSHTHTRSYTQMDNSISQFYLSFDDQTSFRAIRLRLFTSKSQFYVTVWRSNLISCETIAFFTDPSKSFFAPSAARHLAQSRNKQTHWLTIARNHKNKTKNSPNHHASDTNPPSQDWCPSRKQGKRPFAETPGGKEFDRRFSAISDSPFWIPVFQVFFHTGQVYQWYH